MMTNDVKQRIAAEVKARSGNYPSAAKMAVSLDVSPSQLSRIINGDLEKVISDQKWITIARKLEVNIFNNVEWKTAKTTVFDFVTTQLTACQEQSLSAILCDSSDIGKTFTARDYVRKNRNAVLVDCSQHKTKQQLVRSIAKEFGLTASGRYVDIYENITFYLRSIDRPLVILDEAGDLNYEAFLEIKALWNATEGACGWYMMGADGLRAKIDSNLNRNKVGYTEIFSRFGGKYQRISPYGKESIQDFALQQFAAVALANGIDRGNVPELFAKTKGSLRRTAHEIKKSKTVIHG